MERDLEDFEEKNSWAKSVLIRINKQGFSNINTNPQMVRCGLSKTWSVS